MGIIDRTKNKLKESTEKLSNSMSNVRNTRIDKKEQKMLRKEQMKNMQFPVNILSAKEKQNELIKYILIISVIMALFSLNDCIKALTSSIDTVSKIRELIDTYIQSDEELINSIVNTGGTVYQAFSTVKMLIIHLSKALINLITLTILCISRMCLVGKVGEIKNTISKVINIIALVVLFNLVLLLSGINMVDIVAELEINAIRTIFKILGKIVDMGLFLVEIGLIIKYTFFVIKSDNKGDQYERAN